MLLPLITRRRVRTTRFSRNCTIQFAVDNWQPAHGQNVDAVAQILKLDHFNLYFIVVSEGIVALCCLCGMAEWMVFVGGGDGFRFDTSLLRRRTGDTPTTCGRLARHFLEGGIFHHRLTNLLQRWRELSQYHQNLIPNRGNSFLQPPISRRYHKFILTIVLLHQFLASAFSNHTKLNTIATRPFRAL